MTPAAVRPRDAEAVRRLRAALDDLADGPPTGSPIEPPGAPEPRGPGRARVLVVCAALVLVGAALAGLAGFGRHDEDVVSVDVGAPTPIADLAVATAVLDLGLPVDGVSARRAVDLLVWADRHAREGCGIPGRSAMARGDAVEGDVLPDLERIRAEGLVPRPVDETGVVAVEGADLDCYRAAVPGLQEVQEVAGLWLEREVRPLAATPEGQHQLDGAIACAAERLPDDADEIRRQRSLSGLATAATLELDGAALEQRSRELGVVFADCWSAYAAWQRSALEHPRLVYGTRYAVELDELARWLTRAGYRPAD